MALSYLGRDYPSLKEHIRSTGVRTHGESPPLYAHPIDGWITGALEATPVKALLQKPVDTLVSLQHGNKLGSSGFPVGRIWCTNSQKEGRFHARC